MACISPYWYSREAARCFLLLNISLRSLKIIRNNTLEYGLYKSLLVFHITVTIRVGYTIVWSSIHECNECILRETKA